MRAKKIAAVLVALIVSGCNELTSSEPILDISECLEHRQGTFFVLDTPDVNQTVVSLTDYTELASGFMSPGAAQMAATMNDLLFQFVGAQESGQMTPELKSKLLLDLGQHVMLPLEMRAVKLSDKEWLALRSRSYDLKRFFEDAGPRSVQRTGKRYAFNPGRDCEQNRLVLDANSVSERDYKDAEDKDLSLKIYKFPQFSSGVYLVQGKDNTKPDNFYYNFFIPHEDDIYKIYTVTDSKITVMALYGHAYYPDWSPSAGGGQNDLAAEGNPFADLEKQESIYTRMEGELPKEQYDQVYFVQYHDPMFPSMKDRVTGRKEKYVGVSYTNAQQLRAVAFLIDQIETGKLKTSKAMNDDLRVVYMQFEPR